MIFLTNRPVSDFENVDCIFSGISFNNVQGINISQNVVVDIDPQYPFLNLVNLVKIHGCNYIEAPVETTRGDTVYIVQDREQQIIKLEIQK